MTAAAFGQGTGSSGIIIGTVTDATGVVVPRVTVTAIDAGKGTHYTATTDNTGQYRLEALPAADYNVSTQLAGF